MYGENQQHQGRQGWQNSIRLLLPSMPLGSDVGFFAVGSARTAEKNVRRMAACGRLDPVFKREALGKLGINWESSVRQGSICFLSIKAGLRCPLTTPCLCSCKTNSNGLLVGNGHPYGLHQVVCS